MKGSQIRNMGFPETIRLTNPDRRGVCEAQFCLIIRFGRVELWARQASLSAPAAKAKSLLVNPPASWEIRARRTRL